MPFRIAGAVAVIFIVAVLTLASLRHAAYHPAVSVRWSPDLTPTQQAALEERFSLLDPVRNDGSDRTWTYALADASRRNVRALVDHPAVIDTAKIVRASAEIENAIGWPQHVARAMPTAFGVTLVLGAATALALLLAAGPES